MMSESNNLLYHPNDGGFDRLEEMEGGELVRYPVLRSVPVPMPRPWGTRGAVALLMVCGVVFGVIAVVSLSSSPSASEAVTTDNSVNANIGGLSLVNGSGSIEPGTVESGSSSIGDFDVAATAEGTQSSTSDEASDADSDSAINSPDIRAEASAGGSDASSFEDLLASPLESSTAGSQFESFESSASDGFTSESASADSVDEESTSSSDSSDDSLDDWLTESVSASQEASTSDSASAADWQNSLSMSDGSSDSLSLSEDGSFDL